MILSKLKTTMSRLRGLPSVYEDLKSLPDLVVRMNRQIEHIQEALGRIESRQLKENHSNRLVDNEFRVFSQWGEDGIIQFLLEHIDIETKTFVEFGVGDY